MSLKLDNLGNGEQITKLFPKCRPRDVNLNPVPDNHHASAPPPPPTTLTLSSLVMDSDHQPDRSECEGEESCSQEETSMEESNEEEEEDDNSHLPPPDNKVVLQLSSGNKPATYKLRDSRIIEIAGGREVFCQSRSKALRKSRSEDKMNSTARRVKSPDRPGGIWELRSRASEGKKNHGSHEVTETVFSSEVHSVKHARTPSNKVSGGGSVVFDDIEENWNGRGRGRGRSNVPSGGGISSGGSTPSPPGGNYHCSVPPAHFFKVSNSVSDGESISPERERADNKVARVIGGLPIAEYEGSPRRYGPRPQENPVLPSAHSLLASPSVYMPRPGFPQRVVSDDGDGPTDEHSPSHSLMNETRTTFDYLYEFSETRKVLEDFFKPSDNKQNSQQFQEGCEEIETEVSGGGGGGGGGGLSGGQSRNFTLSPETTDCDSNCDSEASSLLAAVEPSPAPARAALGANPTMPVLEDGLSSGHTSDTDNNNPTVLLMKRQITEIEREIVERSNRHNAAVVKLVNGQNGKASSGDEATHPPKNTFSAIIDPADIDLESLDPLSGVCERTPPPPPAPAPHRRMSADTPPPAPSVEAALKDIRLTLQRTKTLPLRSPPSETPPLQLNTSPIWIPRRRGQTGTSGPSGDEEEADTDLETDRLLGQQRTDDHGFYEEKVDKESSKKKGRNREVMIHEPAVLIEGVLFRARYLGSTQLVCEGQPTKSTRMLQAEEAVSRIKAPEGETQPSTEVDLFISTEKIMVLNTDLKEIMMDHALRTISYIADIGDLVVLMARRRFVPHDVDDPPKVNRTPKMICHVFESEEAQFIAQSIGQAFQVAYMEFLKANGIEDHSFVKEMDYQEVLNSQEIFGDELQMFAKKEMQKEVVVPKTKGEILGVVIVESGWGSMLPTVVIANLAPAGAAARCGQLNIGDQIIAINGVSLVGLPLSTCQNYIKNSKTQTVVKLTVVPCAPVVEVKIKRPDTKYQLGFSVQNGVICSLLRGGIAERGGVRVGHRIIEINNQSVVAVPHEKIVNLLATSVGEILMKTMPTSMFRLLTGQETPVYI